MRETMYEGTTGTATFYIKDELDEKILLSFIKKFPEKILKNEGICNKDINGEIKRCLTIKISYEDLCEMRGFRWSLRKIAK